MNTKLLINILCITSLSIFLSSCASDHLLGLKFLPVKYYYELPDGRIISSWYVTLDSSKKKNKTTLRAGKFNRNDIDKYCQYKDTATIQELTVQNLKTDFSNYRFTLISIYYGCPGSFKFDLWQFNKLADTLSKVMNSTDKFAFALISLSYDFARVKYFLNACHYHYQSYLIPTYKYGEELQTKELNFIRELCPSCYDSLKYYAIDDNMLLLDSHGQVLKVIEYEINESGRKEIKDFDDVRDELLKLAKE
ncbi:MAG: hypothetical protein NTW49_08140 [Bacteroidia bacterium]|nr:hypothetical protein [Bacteroidia bacterium]